MCGIVGFTGQHQAAPILLEGLKKLEYRGYDSAGLAVRDGTNLAEVVKSTGKLRNLAEKTDNGNALKGSCGIGHTRWATHGEPSQTNAQPHVSGNCTGSGSGTVESDVVGVHNGIIENYVELKAKLLRHDYSFYSETNVGMPHYVMVAEPDKALTPELRKELSLAVDEFFRECNEKYEKYRRWNMIGDSVFFELEEGAYAAYRELLLSQGRVLNQIKPVIVLNTPERKDFFYGKIKPESAAENATE